MEKEFDELPVETRNEWHKYSEDEKITESGDYVMLLEDCRSLLRHYGVISIRIDSETVHHNFDHWNDLRVIAWMKLPNKNEA